MIPYTYLIGWTKLNKWYYGVRWSKLSNPSELWTQYKTSSRYVKEFYAINGEPDVIEIRKIFNDPYRARLYEEKVLKKLNKLDPFGPNSKWLNRTTNKSICNPVQYERTAEIRQKLRDINLRRGPCSNETREKIRQKAIGRKHSTETKEKIGKGNLGKIMPKEAVDRIAAKVREHWKTHIHPNIGIPRSQEVKDKLRKHRLGKKFDDLYSPTLAQELKNKIKKRMSKCWIITFPDGSEKTINNLKEFCTDNNLNLSCMADTYKGRQKQHRGFSVRRP